MVGSRELPADPDFAHRVERAEAQAWLDLEPTLDGSRPLEVRELDGATLILDRSKAWPNSRVLNLGIQRPATAETVRRILEVAREAGITTLSIDAAPVARPGALTRILQAAGFRETERNAVVARHTAGMPDTDTYFRIRSARRDDVQAVAAFMQRVVPAGPDFSLLLAGQVGRPNWHYYLSSEGGVFCGLGATHVDDDIGWLAPVWVLPEHRRRGTQAAMITHTVKDAASLGVEWVTASYPVALPGRTRNYERLGFSMVYQRRHFLWEAPGA